MAPGPRRLSTGRVGARASPAPRVLLGRLRSGQTLRPPLPPAQGRPPAPPARRWVWGSGPPASATSATLPAPTSIFQKFPVGGAEPQRPPLAPSPAASARGEPETKVAFSSSSWAGSGASPAPLGSWPPCLRDARVAEAPATPAGTEGTDGRWWPQTRRPGAGTRARPCSAGHGAWPGRQPPFALPCCGAAPCPPAAVSLPPLQSSPRWRPAGGSAILCLLRLLLSNWLPEIQNSISDPHPPHPHHLQ